MWNINKKRVVKKKGEKVHSSKVKFCFFLIGEFRVPKKIASSVLSLPISDIFLYTHFHTPTVCTHLYIHTYIHIPVCIYIYIYIASPSALPFLVFLWFPFPFYTFSESFLPFSCFSSQLHLLQSIQFFLNQVTLWFFVFDHRFLFSFHCPVLESGNGSWFDEIGSCNY